MKEVIGKSKVIQPTLLRKIVIIFEEERIANAFNNFYVNIGPKLANDIQTATRSRSSRLEMFCKKGVFRNFAKFTGKDLCQSVFLIKLQASDLQLY